MTTADLRWRLPGFDELGELGAGAFGRVVVARHVESDQYVAIKYLTATLLDDRGFRELFRAEAAILRGIASPWVTRFFDYVEQPSGAAIVMELVQGTPLRTLLRSGAALPPESALALLKGALLGLQDAHQIGVVHRDFKPENVLVTPDGGSKLCDFGIAVRSGDPTMFAAGTAPYMAPEVWRGEPATQAADVYSATATFFECVTGSVPFPSRTAEEVASAHQFAPVPAGVVPENLRVLIERGMAKDPGSRYQSAGSFLGDLEELAAVSYGPNWESRGRTHLAQVAGTAIALMVAALPAGIAALFGAGTSGVIGGAAGLGAVGTGAGFGAGGAAGLGAGAGGGAGIGAGSGAAGAGQGIGAGSHAAGQAGRGAVGRLLRPHTAAGKAVAAVSAGVIAIVATTAIVLINKHQPARPKTFTSAQLAAALLPGPDFAPGYTLSTDWGGASGIVTANPTQTPTASATFLDSCLNAPGYVTSFAVMSPHAVASAGTSGAQTDKINQFVEMAVQMPPGDAAKTFTRYKAAITGHCAVQHWTQKDPDGATRYLTATNDVSRPLSLGDDGFFQNEHIDVTADQQTTTAYQTDQFLCVVVRYGDVMIQLIAAVGDSRDAANSYDLTARARHIAANLGLS